MKAPKPKSFLDMSPRERRIVDGVIKYMSRANAWLYRKSGGRIGGKFFEGTDVCLLTTKGRKSGQPRTVPLLYLRDGERVVVVASKGGSDKHPLWYLNVEADPAVTVQIGGDVQSMTARTAEPDEKAAIWPQLVEYYSGYQDYQDVSPRDIPVVILEPAV